MSDSGTSFVSKPKLHSHTSVEAEPSPRDDLEFVSEVDAYIRGTISCQAKMADQIRQLEYALDCALRQRDEVTQERDELRRLLKQKGSSGVSGETHPRSLLPPEVPPLIARAQEAFHRSLPRLLMDHSGEWIAYHGDKEAGFSYSITDLYQECLSRGIPLNELVVRHIDSDNLEEVLEIDVSLDV